MRVRYGVIGRTVYVLLTSLLAWCGPLVRGAQEAGEEHRALRQNLMQACEEHRALATRGTFARLDNPGALIPTPEIPWPDDSVVMYASLPGDLEGEYPFAIPREAMRILKLGIPDPTKAQDEFHSIIFSCWDFSLSYLIRPVRLKDSIAQAIQEVRTKCAVPSEVAAPIDNALNRQSELDLWRAALSLSAADWDYSRVGVGELYRRAVLLDTMEANGWYATGTTAELSSGPVTLLVSYSGENVLSSKICDYPLFIDEQLYWRISVHRRTETAERPYRQNWRETLAHVHRSIFACALKGANATLKKKGKSKD